MKKIYTFEIKRKIQWPRTRCPKCHNGWIDIWHQIKPDPYEENEDAPYFHAAWTVKCPNCGLQTYAFHTRRTAWAAWKDMCKTGKDFSYDDWMSLEREE